MNLSTKLRKKGIEINQGGKRASMKAKRLAVEKLNPYDPTSKRTSSTLCTKKHTRGRLKNV